MNRDNKSNDATTVFRGRSMQDAVNQLKEEMGPDAVIVGTTRGSDRDGRFVEITASLPKPRTGSSGSSPRKSNPLASAAYANTARSTSPLSKILPSVDQKDGPFADRAKWLAEQVAARAGAPSVTKSAVDDLMALRNGPIPKGSSSQTAAQRYLEIDDDSEVRGDDLATLRATVKALSEKVSGLTEQPIARLRTNTDDRQATLNARLDGVGVAREYAAEATRRAFLEVPEATCDDGDLLRSLEAILAEDMSDYESVATKIEQSRVVAFVGATGIGKTTTIAKLATQAKLRGEKVALITLDTIRLAAVDQLTRFSEVLSVPLTVVARPSELAEAMDLYRAYDKVFVDTAGKSPYDGKQLKSLAEYFPEGWGGEIVLTVSSTARQTDLFQNLDAFALLRPSGVCVTKLDETRAIGAVYTAMRRSDLPVVWITDGQRIPEDIASFDACQFAVSLLGKLRALSAMSSVA